MPDFMWNIKFGKACLTPGPGKDLYDSLDCGLEASSNRRLLISPLEDDHLAIQQAASATIFRSIIGVTYVTDTGARRLIASGWSPGAILSDFPLACA